MDERMEREYRDALDALRFSDERKEQMMKNLTDQLDQSPARRRGVHFARTGLFAAVLCAALLLTAGAAVYQLTVRVVKSDHAAGYRVYGDLTRFPLSAFSPELIAACEENREPAGIVQPEFAAKEEAWDFLGRSIPCIWAGGGDTWGYRVMAWQSGNEENRRLDGVRVYYSVPAPAGMAATVEASVVTETMEPPEGWDGTIGGMLENQERRVERLESYAMPNGATAEVVMVHGAEDRAHAHSQCYGSFLYEGILYQVRIDGLQDVPREEFTAQLHAVLDSFS